MYNKLIKNINFTNKLMFIKLINITTIEKHLFSKNSCKH